MKMDITMDALCGVIVVGNSTNLKHSKATSRTPNRPSKATKSAKSPWWKFEERGTGVNIDYRDLRERSIHKFRGSSFEADLIMSRLTIETP